MSSQQEITLPARSAFTDAETEAGSIFFIGNATVLIRFAGFTILTDPTFIHRHEQVGIGYGMHATRLTNPALDIAALPPLDLIVLSHFHGDHFDQVAERALDKALPIVTTSEAAKELNTRGFTNTIALETWSSALVRRGNVTLKITATPARHGPPVVNLALPEVMGSMLEFQASGGDPRYRIYITGDTLMMDDLLEIPNRFPGIDLALLHLGGTEVMGVMLTMDGKQGAEAMLAINPKVAIPIHYNDYDVFKSPLSDFQRATEAAGLAEHVHYLYHGDTYRFTSANASSALSTQL